MALDTIPKQEGGKLKAVASGTLPSGQPVVVNSDGTVSVIAASSESGGSPVTFNSGNANDMNVVYDSNSNRIVISYLNTAVNGYPTAIVGTVSGSSISFGTSVVYNSGAGILHQGSCFDSGSNKVIVAWAQSGGGRARVGTVNPSNNSISFGATATFESGTTSYVSAVYDVAANRTVISYEDEGNGNYGTSTIGTVSGTSISFGTPVTFNTSNTDYITSVYDPDAEKVVIMYEDRSGNILQAIVGTVSGTSISFGTEVTIASVYYTYLTAVYDTNSSKVVVAGDSSGTLDFYVGTVSGTSVSFGSVNTLSGAGDPGNMRMTFDSSANKVVLAFQASSDGSKGKIAAGSVSGSTISFDPLFTFTTNVTTMVAAAYDSTAQRSVISYRDNSDSLNGKAVVYAASSTNLTSENYIGMSGGAIDSEVISQALGSAVVFESATVGSNVASTFDSNSNKVVIVYQDTANSFYGTAIVGTVSGTSISFGSPVVFSSANRTQEIQITFDSNSNKVVVAYDDKADGQKGKAIVGTVSGTSISFGSAVVFNNGSTDTGTPNAITFDSNSNKVVIAFQDKADTNKGKAIVGTVSGTSISFGSEATFLNADYATHVSATFDSNSNKVVIVYKDGSNSLHGYAVVGTVSGTNITFGTPVVFEAAETNNPNVSFDTVNNKIVIAYADGTVGTAIVGTVSGTSISFGSPVVFNSTETTQPRVRFDATASKIVIAYGEGSGNAGTFKTGTVSGTSISFGSATVFESGATNAQNGLVYDSNAGKMVLSYYSGSNSGYGTSKVLQTGYTAITRGQVASGGAATVDIVGTVSTNQVGLTAGQQYYVQTDGTLSETPADPSVFAGTAISATSLVVKT
jgi:hypothetical protein